MIEPCQEPEPCEEGNPIVRFICENGQVGEGEAPPSYQPICPPPGEMPHPNLSGPDEPGIYCWIPTDCCAPSPCAIREDQFICAVRSLLPEGEIFNNTLIAYRELPVNRGVITVGCARVGCEQLIFGGCCDDRILCDDEPIAPQLAVVDAFAAAAYKVIPALCELLRELDPCTAHRNVRRWAERFGIKHPDLCGGRWSDELLAFLICLFLALRGHVMNWDYLTKIAAMFGAKLEIFYAGDINCSRWPAWWTMARDQPECDRAPACRDDPEFYNYNTMLRLRACDGKPQSLNLVLCPSDITLPANCNLPQTVPQTRPHDPERYQAFKWLLPQILPGAVFWGFYECDNVDDCGIPHCINAMA